MQHIVLEMFNSISEVSAFVTNLENSAIPLLHLYTLYTPSPIKLRNNWKQFHFLIKLHILS